VFSKSSACGCLQSLAHRRPIANALRSRAPIPPSPQLALQLRELQAPQGTPQALSSQEVDLITTWLLIIMLTAQELGVPFGWQPGGAAARSGSSSDGGGGSAASGGQPAAEGGGVTRRHGPQSLGLLAYVKSTLGRYDSEGHNLARVAALQSVTRQPGKSDPDSGSGGFSQAADVMQQYTRLVLITLESTAVAGLPLNRPLQEPITITAPTGFPAALLGADLSEAAARGAAPAPPAGARRAAVHLLVAFIGAVLGAPYALQQFLAAAADAYDEGLAAGELLGALSEGEFLQAGGLLPVATPEPGAAQAITRQLFARWAARPGGGGWGAEQTDPRADAPGAVPAPLPTPAAGGRPGPPRPSFGGR
jgi:hypothetical protein